MEERGSHDISAVHIVQRRTLTPNAGASTATPYSARSYPYRPGMVGSHLPSLSQYPIGSVSKYLLCNSFCYGERFDAREGSHIRI